MKQKIIDFILENLILEEGITAEEWAEEILASRQTIVSFMSHLVKKGKKRVLRLDGKVEAFCISESWPYRLVTRRFEPGSIPEGYYLTEEEAKEAYQERQKIISNSRKLSEPKADEIFKKIEEDYEQLLKSLKSRYGAELYPNGEALDDTGLETYMAVDFTVKGEDGIPHEFSYQLKE